MGENAPHVSLHPRLRPVGMLDAQAGGLHFARGPIQAPGHLQPCLAGHGAKDFDLLWAGLFIRQHGLNMCYRGPSRKQNAVGLLFLDLRLRLKWPHYGGQGSGQNTGRHGRIAGQRGCKGNAVFEATDGKG